MAYDDELLSRLRATFARHDDVTEKKMFGGIAFFVHGNMACGLNDDDLVLRLGKDGTKSALTEPHTRPFDMTGKPMSTMLYVGPDGHAGDAALTAWTDRALAFARSLPPKAGK